MAGLGRRVWVADEVLEAADLQDYIQDQVVFVYDSAAARTAGILAPTEGMVSYLKDTNLLYRFDGSNWVDILPDTGTAGTYSQVTTDAKGRVTSGVAYRTGEVIQVQSTTTGTTMATSGTSWTDVSGLSVSITPKATSSKILVFFDAHFGTSTNDTFGVRLMRDSTAIAIGDALGNRERVTSTAFPGVVSNANFTLLPTGMNHLDSPSTTSAVTYKVQVKAQASTSQVVYVNRNNIDTDLNSIVRTVSSITVMEIAG